MSVILKGIDIRQSVLKIPTQKLKQSKESFPVIIGKRLAESAKLNKGDKVQLRWRDAKGTYDANSITIIDVFDSNVPNIDNGKIWIDINKLWQITGLENQASYFIVKDDFNKAAFPYWKFKSKESLLKNLKELIDQKKQVNHLFRSTSAIALLAIFDTQILSIFREKKK